MEFTVNKIKKWNALISWAKWYVDLLGKFREMNLHIDETPEGKENIHTQ